MPRLNVTAFAPALVVAWAAAALPLSAQVAGGTLVIRGGTVHTLAGPPLERATILVRDGRIAGVGGDAGIPSGAPVIDATGLQVYPGFFDAITRLGLTEIGQVDVTNDMLELGEFNPHLDAATAIHPASEHIPVARANGITHTASAPNARPGGIGGQASLINLDGWTIEEMLIRRSVGVVMSWPSLGGGGGFGFGGFGGFQQRSFRERQRQYQERVARLEEWLDEARRYDEAVRAGRPVPRDLKLETMAKVVRKELPLLVTANDQRDIRNAVEFAGKHALRIVILGGREAWKERALLAEKGIPVILGPTQTLPSGQDEGYDEQYAQPGMLHEAGVKFAISTFNSSDSRTLPYEAGTAVPYGLPRDEALRAITIYPAEILGVADQLGTIETGKLANLVITDGDPLDIRTQVRHVIINGYDVGLGNRHSDLYEKYRARPKR